MRAINHDLSASFCLPASCEAPGLPAVRVRLLLSLLEMVLVMVLLQLTATSARTGRRLTAHIISTDTRSQACISCRVCMCMQREGGTDDLIKHMHVCACECVCVGGLVWMYWYVSECV